MTQPDLDSAASPTTGPWRHAGLALALGVAWYLVGRYVPPQLDLVARVALLLATLALARIVRPNDPDRTRLGVGALLLLGMLLWRDAPMLAGVTGAAVLLLVALLVPGPDGQSLMRSGLEVWAGRVARAVGGFMLGAVPALAGVGTRARQGGAWRPLLAVGLGLAAIAPVLAIFTALLSEADPRFGELLRSLEALMPGPEVLAALLALWQAAGVLWVMAWRPPRWSVPRLPAVPIATVVTALVPVQLLFGLFLGLQTRYLFGGHAHVLATEGLTVATYARRGFFELVAVVVLTLPVLVLAEACIAPSRVEDRRRLRRHAMVVIAMLALMLVSALSRMLLYTATFGLTPARLGTTVFMAWLAGALAWFAMTSLRGERERFPGGALALGVAGLLLLNAVGVDGTVVRVNVGRAERGRPVDAAYLAQLGAGAVPALLRHAHRLPQPARCEALDAMRARLDRAPDRKARWNVEADRARRVLAPDVARAADAACLRN